ncbi:MAG: hypothetical protein ABSC55_08225 [Syntrophorhabdales bacterium]
MTQFGGRGKGILMATMVVLVFAVATFAVLKVFKTSAPTTTKESATPSVAPPKGAGWIHYGSDEEGQYYYTAAEGGMDSPDIARVWSQLVFTAQSKQTYIQARQQRGMPTAGYDRLTHRDVLYEMNCMSSSAEFCIREVFELTGEEKSLDYARAGSEREWQHPSEGSMLEKLWKVACPPKWNRAG